MRRRSAGSRQALPSVKPQITAKNARDIYTSAEDFRIAASALTEHNGEPQAWARVFGPYVVLEAFAAELYIKCILVDGGAPTIPGKHKLTELFRNVHAKTRGDIEKIWRSLGAHFKFSPMAQPFEQVLCAIGNHFELWRYRFENESDQLRRGEEIRLVNLALWGYIIERHPDWKDEDHSYFAATFPVL